MRPMMLARIALASSLASLSAAQEQGTGMPDRIALAGGREMRVIDARSLLAPYRLAPYMPVIGTHAVWFDDSHETISDGLPKSPVGPEVLASLLDAVFGEVSEAARNYRSIKRQSVFVVDGKEKVDRVAKFVANLERTIAARIAVDCLVFESEESPRKLTLEQAQELANSVRSRPDIVLFDGAAEGRVGDELSMMERGRSAFVKEINVEVAEKIQISDPEIDHLETGPSLVVQAMPCPNGASLAVLGLFTQRSLVGPIERKELDAESFGYVELPKVEILQSALSTRFDADGGLLLAPGGSRSPGLRVLVTIRRLDAPEKADDYAIVPTGLLGSSAFRRFAFDAPSFTEEDNSVIDLSLGDDDPNDLIQTLWRFSELDVDATNTEKHPGFLVIHGGRGGIAGARRFAGVLERAVAQSFTIELIAEQRAVGQASAAWKRRGEPLRIHCLGDHAGVAIDAEAQNYVRDYNVEVAQLVGACDPVVDTIFDGVHAIAGVESLPDGARVTIAVCDQALLGIRTADAPAPKLGKIHLPTTKQVRLRRVLRMTAGETRLLGPGVHRTAGTATVETRWHARLLNR